MGFMDTHPPPTILYHAPLVAVDFWAFSAPPRFNLFKPGRPRLQSSEFVRNRGGAEGAEVRTRRWMPSRNTSTLRQSP
jgi:hypothetical protein